MCKFRDLTADEIEVRVQSVSAKGAVLLLYKDARCDMNILDETVGADNWQNKFYEHKGILFCSLGINTNWNKPTEPDRWVWKDDAGVESNTEAEKGNASDARKRSGFAWGIGRELYTSPFVWVKAENCEIKDGTNGKKVCYDKFSVESITIKDKRIVALTIKNDTQNKVAFSWGNKEPKTETPPVKATITSAQQKELLAKYEAKHGKIETEDDKIAYGMLLSAFDAKKTADIKTADFDKVLKSI